MKSVLGFIAFAMMGNHAFAAGATYKVLSINNGFCVEHNLYSVALGNVGSTLQVTIDPSGVTFVDPNGGFSNTDSYPVGTFTQGIMDDSGNLIEIGKFTSPNVYEQDVHGQKGSDPGDVYFVRVTSNGQNLTYESGNQSGITHTCQMTLQP